MSATVPLFTADESGTSGVFRVITPIRIPKVRFGFGEVCCSLIVIIIMIVVGVSYHSSSNQNKPALSSLANDMLQYMNVSVDPCSDFYTYACGNWSKVHPPPKGAPSWNAIAALERRNLEAVKDFLESQDNYNENKNLRTILSKIRRFYSTCMDTSAINERGSRPVLQLLTEIDRLPLLKNGWDEGTWQLEVTLAKVHQYASPLFSMIIGEDAEDTSAQIITFDQAGLLYGQRGFYTGDDFQLYRDAEIALIKRVAVILGAADDDELQANAEEIYDIELSLANISLTMATERDSLSTYHRMKVEDLQDRLGDKFDLESYMIAAFGKTISGRESIIVKAPTYFTGLGAYLQNTTWTKRKLANYVAWHAVKQFIPYLSQDFREANLQWTTSVYGVTESGPTWVTCTSLVNEVFNFLIGGIFTEKRYRSYWSSQLRTMIEGIQHYFLSDGLSWMDYSTYIAAGEKITKMGVQLPEKTLRKYKWSMLYEDITITDDSFDNIKQLLEQAREGSLTKDMSSIAEVDANAFYTPLLNAICILPGILEKPFFGHSDPRILNYARIGAVIGHELTHAFDDNGRHFDASGELNDWWTSSSAEKFQEYATCLVDQYNQFPVGDSHINGQLTLGENIADNGGLKATYEAYHRLSTRSDDLDSFSDLHLNKEQLFFLGFAQIWCSGDSPDFERFQLIEDVHSNFKYRVIGTLQNMEEFSTAYSCEAGSVMNPQKKCTLW